MRAAVFKGPRNVVVEDVQEPQIAGDFDVKIRVDTCNLCGSDLHGWVGTAGARESPTGRPGHEWSGYVTAVGAKVRFIKAGDAVTGVAIQGCMQCEICHAGYPQGCEKRQVVGFDIAGGFGEYLVIQEPWVIRLPSGINMQLAALAEPLSVAENCVNNRCGTLTPDMTALVQGPGGIGMFVALALRARGLNVILSGLYDKDSAVRLAAANNLGFRTIATTPETNLADELDRLTGKRTIPLIVDATGSPKAIEAAISLLPYRGTISPVAIYSGPAAVPLTPMVRGEQQILFSYGSALPDYHRAIALISKGVIPGLDNIGTRFALNQINDAFAAAHTCQCLRPYVQF